MKNQRSYKFQIIFLFIIIIFISYYYIFFSNNTNNQTNNIGASKQVNKLEVELLVSSMTNEEKVGQLFLCAFRKDSDANNIYFLNDEARAAIEKYNLGGVILFSENMQSISQTKKLISQLKEIPLGVPMFISIDSEGGLVDRLANSSLFPNLPYISKLGNTNDPNLAFEYSKIIGRRLSSLGFNLNFAPVCDLDNSDVIQYRSFGKDPNMVGKMVESYINGLDKYNIGSTLKHFPGLGNSIGDTHNVMSTSNVTLDALERSDFIPFKYGINAGSNIIMMNHVEYSNLSNISLPASLNSDIYGILRDKLNFDGIVITDGLEMRAITKQTINTSASYAAFVAGADMLLLPKDIDLSYKEILKAVNTGKISQERLNSSVKRIVTYKYELGLFLENKLDINSNYLNDQKMIDKINK